MPHGSFAVSGALLRRVSKLPKSGSPALPNCPSIFAQKAGRSSGFHLVANPWSTTTSSSTHLVPHS